jgi:hypothetical protein
MLNTCSLKKVPIHLNKTSYFSDKIPPREAHLANERSLRVISGMNYLARCTFERATSPKASAGARVRRAETNSHARLCNRRCTPRGWVSVRGAHVLVRRKETLARPGTYNALATANTCERRHRPHICALDRPTPRQMQMAQQKFAPHTSLKLMHKL